MIIVLRPFDKMEDCVGFIVTQNDGNKRVIDTMGLGRVFIDAKLLIIYQVSLWYERREI